MCQFPVSQLMKNLARLGVTIVVALRRLMLRQDL